MEFADDSSPLFKEYCLQGLLDAVAKSGTRFMGVHTDLAALFDSRTVASTARLSDRACRPSTVSTVRSLLPTIVVPR